MGEVNQNTRLFDDFTYHQIIIHKIRQYTMNSFYFTRPFKIHFVCNKQCLYERWLINNNLISVNKI